MIPIPFLVFRSFNCSSISYLSDKMRGLSLKTTLLAAHAVSAATMAKPGLVSRDDPLAVGLEELNELARTAYETAMASTPASKVEARLANGCTQSNTKIRREW